MCFLFSLMTSEMICLFTRQIYRLHLISMNFHQKQDYSAATMFRRPHAAHRGRHSCAAKGQMNRNFFPIQPFWTPMINGAIEACLPGFENTVIRRSRLEKLHIIPAALQARDGLQVPKSYPGPGTGSGCPTAHGKHRKR